MTDYHTVNRKRFLRQLRYMALLRGFYVGLVGLSAGATAAALLLLLLRKP